MARPLRLELAGGLYHGTSRGDGREDIDLIDTERTIWVEVFGQTCARYNSWRSGFRCDPCGPAGVAALSGFGCAPPNP